MIGDGRVENGVDGPAGNTRVNPRNDAIGFVGAGSMGGPMVHRMLTAGLSVTVLSRRAEAAAEFTAAGANITNSLSEAVAGRRVVIVCLFDENQLEQVVLAPGGVVDHLDADSTLVVHTTAGPEIMRQIADRAATRNATVIDAPISGSALDITEGRLTVLAGGDPGTIAAVEPVVATYAARYVPIGPLGTASAVKLVNNLLFAANVQLVAEAVAVGEQLGIAPSVLTDAIANCSGASQAMDRIRSASSVQAFGARVGKYLSKDAAAALALADSLGAEAPLLAHAVTRGPLDLGLTLPN
ncbi:NAD(P)-dependent oxidoreductase [Rhodococcus koreensis]